MIAVWTSVIEKSHVNGRLNPKLSERFFVLNLAMGVTLAAWRISGCLSSCLQTTLLGKMDRQDPESSRKRTFVHAPVCNVKASL